MRIWSAHWFLVRYICRFKYTLLHAGKQSTSSTYRPMYVLLTYLTMCWLICQHVHFTQSIYARLTLELHTNTIGRYLTSFLLFNDAILINKMFLFIKIETPYTTQRYHFVQLTRPLLYLLPMSSHPLLSQDGFQSGGRNLHSILIALFCLEEITTFRLNGRII